MVAVVANKGSRLAPWAAFGCLALALCTSSWTWSGAHSVELFTAPHAEIAPFQRVWNPDTNNDHTVADFSQENDESDDDPPLCGLDGKDCPNVPAFGGENYFDSKPIGCCYNKEQQQVWSKWLALNNRVAQLEGTVKALRLKKASVSIKYKLDPKARGRPGPPGPAGPQGDQGLQGARYTPERAKEEAVKIAKEEKKNAEIAKEATKKVEASRSVGGNAGGGGTSDAVALSAAKAKARRYLDWARRKADAMTDKGKAERWLRKCRRKARSMVRKAGGGSRWSWEISSSDSDEVRAAKNKARRYWEWAQRKAGGMSDQTKAQRFLRKCRRKARRIVRSASGGGGSSSSSSSRWSWEVSSSDSDEVRAAKNKAKRYVEWAQRKSSGMSDQTKAKRFLRKCRRKARSIVRAAGGGGGGGWSSTWEISSSDSDEVRAAKTKAKRYVTWARGKADAMTDKGKAKRWMRKCRRKARKLVTAAGGGGGGSSGWGRKWSKRDAAPAGGGGGVEPAQLGVSHTDGSDHNDSDSADPDLAAADKEGDAMLGYDASEDDSDEDSSSSSALDGDDSDSADGPAGSGWHDLDVTSSLGDGDDSDHAEPDDSDGPGHGH